MLSWKRDSADIADDVPSFHVRYVGTTETFIPNGKGCTTQPLQKLWDNAPSERHLRKVAIKFSVRGIYMYDVDSKNGENNSAKWFIIEDISFCAADTNVNDRLFCWISKEPVSGKLEVHAVLCNTRDMAQSMASVLSRAFQVAYKDWIAERQREKRRIAINSVAFPEAGSGSTSSRPVSHSNCGPISSSRSSAQNMNMIQKAEKQTESEKQPD